MNVMEVDNVWLYLFNLLDKFFRLNTRTLTFVIKDTLFCIMKVFIQLIAHSKQMSF